MQWPDVLEAFRLAVVSEFDAAGVTDAKGEPVPVFLGLPARAPNRDAVYIWRKHTLPDHASCQLEATGVYVEIWTRPASPNNTTSDQNEENTHVYESWKRLAKRTALIKAIKFGRIEPNLFACSLKEQLGDGNQFHPLAAERLEYITSHTGKEV